MTPFAEAAELEIDLSAIASNWRLLNGRAARTGGAAAAVLKADAYGLGAARVGPALFEAGCRHYFVAHLNEALAIRAALPGVMIAALNGLWPSTELQYVEHGIRPVLGSLGEIDAWSSTAARLGRALPALLHVDTGMNRLGLSPADLQTLAAQPSRLHGVAIDYVMTHLVSAESPQDESNGRQRRHFEQACACLPPAKRSLANSSGLFLGPAFASDLARPGAALHGVNPTPGSPNPMRPAVRLTARILQVRTVRPGESVGYNALWQAGRESRIAAVSVGYADGFFRCLENRAVAYFDDTPVPLVGRVSMDLTTFDVTDAPGAQAGSLIELIGRNVSVDSLARRAGTTGYEVLTNLGRRYARTYLPA